MAERGAPEHVSRDPRTEELTGSFAIDLVGVSDKVPADAREAVDKVRAGLKDGSFAIWKGPIAGQDGKPLLKDGETADDEWLHKINFYVKGVEGKLPNAK